MCPKEPWVNITLYILYCIDIVYIYIIYIYHINSYYIIIYCMYLMSHSLLDSIRSLGDKSSSFLSQNVQRISTRVPREQVPEPHWL